MSKKIKIYIAVIMSIVICLTNISRIVSYASESNMTFNANSIPPVEQTGDYDVYVCAGYSPNADNAERESVVGYGHANGTSEIVAYYERHGESTRMRFISRSDFKYSVRRVLMYTNGSTSVQNSNTSSKSFEGNDGFKEASIASGIEISIPHDMWNYSFISTNTYVFDSYDNAVLYLNTGTLNGVTNEPDKQYDGANIYLEDFKIIVHDSNSFDHYYIEFRYSIPDCLKNANSLFLAIDEEYQFETNAILSAMTDSCVCTGNKVIDILDFPTGFKLYLEDIEAVTDLFNHYHYIFGDGQEKRAVIGYEGGLLDTSSISIDGVGGECIMKNSKSLLYLDCQVIADNQYGVQYTGSVDFLSGSNSMSSYTPDTDGNYSYNDDYNARGHYYTEVGTDGAGNTTYNYYYYNIDNSKTEISSEDSYNNNYSDDNESGEGNGSTTTNGGTTINNNPTFNPTFNNNVTVEGDTIDNDINNIIENDTTTKEDNDSFIDKFLGFFNLLDNNSFLSVLTKVFGWLPSVPFSVLVGAIGIIAGIAVIKFFRK